MDNREFLFEKIDAKQKEWEEQVRYLQSKAAEFDSDTREKVEEQIKILNLKLKEIENRTNELKRSTNQASEDIADKIVHSWIELFTKIDNAMMKLKK